MYKKKDLAEEIEKKEKEDAGQKVLDSMIKMVLSAKAGKKVKYRQARKSLKKLYLENKDARELIKDIAKGISK